MLVPTTGGSPTPSWNAHDHFAFMASNGIKHGVMSISAPGTGVYDVVGGYSEHAAAALARLLNEYLAALAGAYPEYLSFYAVMPLPYSERAFKEATYALECLGASGMGVLSNHEGKYIGNPAITPFFARLNGRNASKTVVSVHPNEPVLNLNGTFISADPSLYSQILAMAKYTSRVADLCAQPYTRPDLSNSTSRRHARSWILRSRRPSSTSPICTRLSHKLAERSPPSKIDSSSPFQV